MDISKAAKVIAWDEDPHGHDPDQLNRRSVQVVISRVPLIRHHSVFHLVARRMQQSDHAVV